MADEAAYRSLIAAALAGQYKPSPLADLINYGGGAVEQSMPTIDQDPELERVERRSSDPDSIKNALASYMRSNGKFNTINALFDSGIGAGSALLGGAMGLTPAAALPLGHAVYRGVNALNQFHNAADYYKAADMWNSTGLPSAPSKKGRR